MSATLGSPADTFSPALTGLPVIVTPYVPVGRLLVFGGRIYAPAVRRSAPARAAVTEAVEIVRAGLAHLVPRDPTVELFVDLTRGRRQHTPTPTTRKATP